MMLLFRVFASLLAVALAKGFQPLPFLSSHLSAGSVSPSLKIQRRNCHELHSIKSLIDHVEASTSKPPTIFVGGKGGVGKTTVSSAIGVQLAQNPDLGKILIVSTDPAHSLGDCLDVDTLQAQPTLLPDASGRLYGQEVDASAALGRFREALSAFDVDRLSEALQIPPDLLSSLGLEELSGVLQNPPPGLDELVAMADIFGEGSADYGAIVVDTAPTGHTLRLLALPKFLDGLLGKLIKLRMRLSGIASTLQTLLGGGEAASERAAAVDNALQKIEQFQKRMAVLKETLTDAKKTQFVVVSIPTALSTAESKRLVTELRAQSVAVSHLVINQCIGESENGVAYYDRRRASQQKWIERLTERVDAVSQSAEFKSNGAASSNIRLTQVPFFDVELVGVPALGYVGAQVFADYEDSSGVIICGGKGGVGKTTTAASLGVTLAAAGRNVALISTDPAHSLGDAVGMTCSSTLQQCPLIGVPGDVGTGSLSVMEIDPTTALGKFKGYLDQLVSSDSVSNPAIGETLKEISEIFDTLPAGTDEVVALAQIVGLVKEGKYDRIILDTDLIERVLKISDKINSSTAVKLFLGSRKEEMEATVQATKSKLLSFQFQMYDMEDLFSNPDSTEFLIVTIPTELAVRESMRLLNDLTFDEDLPVKVKHVVVNQVLGDDDGNRFLSAVSKRQQNSLDDLNQMAQDNGVTVTQVPYLDTEPRGVYGLIALGNELLKEKVESS